MTMEELTARVETLERLLREFSSAPELAPDIKKTIGAILTTTSSKTAASATQAVSESGSASYNVMKAPSGFLSIGGKNVPYID